MTIDYIKPIPKIKITNNTTRTLKNGKVIPTWTAMEREAKKI